MKFRKTADAILEPTWRFNLFAEGDGDAGDGGGGDTGDTAGDTGDAPGDTGDTASDVGDTSGSGDTAPPPLDIGAVLSSEEWVKHVPTDFLPTATKYKSFHEFTKAHGELNSRMGTAIFQPADDASPEDIAKFYGRLGRPEDAAGYELPKVDGFEFPEARANAVRAAYHEAGLSKAAAERLLKFEAESTVASRTAAMAAHKEAHGKLEKAWGEETGVNYEKARRAGMTLFSAEQREALGMGDDPKTWAPGLVSALAAKSASFGDDTHITRAEGDMGRSDEDLRKEVEALNIKNYEETATEAEQARRTEIYQLLEGTSPVGPGQNMQGG